MRLLDNFIPACGLFILSCLPLSGNAQINISAYPSLSDMPSEEICMMLASGIADSTVSSKSVARLQLPLDLTAEDFVTKVYGVFKPSMTGKELSEASGKLLSLVPEQDEMGLWLNTDQGYDLKYYGMTPPETSAMARLERDSITDFGFFFIFPYDNTSKTEANRQQADFCGALLQELHDIGAILSSDEQSADLFEVTGEYKGHFLNARLIDETSYSKVTGNQDGSGRYILMLSIEPKGFSAADNLAIL